MQSLMISSARNLMRRAPAPLLVLLFASCPVGAEEAARPPEIKLINAGAAPRRELRLAPKTGQSDRMVMDMTMSMAMDMGGRKAPATKSPPIRMGMEIKVDDVKPGGDIHYTARFTEAGAVGDDPAQKAMAAMINASMGAMKEVSIEAVVSDQGHPRSFELKGLDKLPAAMKQQMGGMESQFSQMAAPMPAEAVGVGAKWEVAQHINANGIAVDQTCAYEITAITGDRIDMKISLLQSGKEQLMKNEALPAGTTIKVLKLASTGEGSATFDLAHISPVSSTVRVHSATEMEVNMAGTAQRMSTDMDMVMDMKSEPVKP